MKSPLFRSQLFLIIFSLLACFQLPHCGEGGEPFEMVMNATIIVGDAEPDGGIKAISNPTQETVEGIAEGVITLELHDRFEVEILSVDISTTFPEIGEVRLVLNPNFVSSGTVFKLNRNNNLFGNHSFILNLIVETPDQNLTIDDITLEANNAVLTVVGDLPTLGFLFEGQSKEIDILNLELLIPSQLVVTTDDPQ
jgi:hypothetical protein